MARMTDRLQRFVVDDLYGFKLFKVGDFVRGKRMTGHTGIGALGHHVHVGLVRKIDIRSIMALLPPFLPLLFLWLIRCEHTAA
jgi:hypothetical protein